MNKVYAVGCLHIDLAPNTRRIIREDRLWHLFARFEDAEECVLKNRGDLFECTFNFALIEETYVIDPTDPPKEGEQLETPREWWYFADHSKSSEENDYNPEVSACEKPKPLEKTVYFWIG